MKSVHRVSAAKHALLGKHADAASVTKIPGRRLRSAGVRDQKVFAALVVIASITLGLTFGCGQLSYRLSKKSVPDTYVPNPIELPPASDQFVWSQVVDAVDDYFHIAREQPVQNSDGIILDGRIETAYKIGSSILEPWQKDSTRGFERLQSTFQSIRRKATVIVRPRGAAYTLEVVVQKDLEDTDRSQDSSEATAVERHDGTLLRVQDSYDNTPRTLGWIPLGRDTSLEQVILRDIFARITQADGGKFLHH